MKKTILILLALFASTIYGQQETEKLKITENAQDATAIKVNVQSSTDEVNWRFMSDLPVSYPVRDSLNKKLNLPTGFLQGLQLSINVDPTKYNIAPGYYVVTDFTNLAQPVVKIITYPGATGLTPAYLASANSTYIALDINGNVVPSASPFSDAQRRTLAIVGNVVHSNNSTINVTNEIKAPIVAIGNQLHDFMKAIGFLNESGNIYSANGANLQINKSLGDIWGMGINASDYTQPHKLTIGAQTALTFAYRFQNGDQLADTQNINPNIYDVGGTSTATPSNKWTIQRINLFQSGISRIQPGQTIYNSFNDAVTALPTQPFVTEQNIADNAVFRCYLIVQQGTTNLASAVAGGTAQFVPVDKFGNIVGNGSVALTYANVVAAIGYTPANVTDLNTTAIQNLSNAPGSTATAALNSLNSKSTYTTPEEFGAASDGISDDKTPIQNAINSGKMVLLNGNYYTSGTITISNKTTIIGNGRISTTSNLPIFDIKANDVVVEGIRFEGNGRGSVTNYVTTRPLQIGVNLEGVVDVTVYKNIRISNVSFYNLGGVGVKIASNKNVNNEGNAIISNCYAELCYIGYFLAERGEYNSFSNVKAYGGEYGVYDIGGNNPFSNSTFERNRTGMYYTTGVNPGHSTISGGSINHNIDKGVDVVNLGDGPLFNGVQILNNDIYISGSDNTQFLNCNIRSTNISITTSTNTNFKNCKFTTTPSVFTGISSCLFSSTEWTGSPPIGFTDTNEQPLSVIKKLSVNTGFTATLNIPSQFNGSFDFGNGSSSLGIPTLVGKSNDSTGLTFISAANDANASPDMIFNVRENDNTDFSTLTTVAFRFSRFGTNLLDIFRNGNATFSGNITAANLTSGSYTPAVTNIANTSSLSGQTSYYTNFGNIITLTVRFNLTETSANAATSFRITLPVNRTSSTAKIAIGSGVVIDNGTTGEKPIRASFDTTNNSSFLVSYRTTGVTGATSGTVTIQYSTAE